MKVKAFILSVLLVSSIAKAEGNSKVLITCPLGVFGGIVTTPIMVGASFILVPFYYATGFKALAGDHDNFFQVFYAFSTNTPKDLIERGCSTSSADGQ